MSLLNCQRGGGCKGGGYLEDVVLERSTFVFIVVRYIRYTIFSNAVSHCMNLDFYIYLQDVLE